MPPYICIQNNLISRHIKNNFKFGNLGEMFSASLKRTVKRNHQGFFFALFKAKNDRNREVIKTRAVHSGCSNQHMLLR